AFFTHTQVPHPLNLIIKGSDDGILAFRLNQQALSPVCQVSYYICQRFAQIISKLLQALVRLIRDGQGARHNTPASRPQKECTLFYHSISEGTNEHCSLFCASAQHALQ